MSEQENTEASLPKGKKRGRPRLPDDQIKAQSRSARGWRARKRGEDVPYLKPGPPRLPDDQIKPRTIAKRRQEARKRGEDVPYLKPGRPPKNKSQG